MTCSTASPATSTASTGRQRADGGRPSGSRIGSRNSGPKPAKNTQFATQAASAAPGSSGAAPPPSPASP